MEETNVTRLALICDDDERRVKTWVRNALTSLGDGWEVLAVTQGDLAELTKRLADAERIARDGSAATESAESANGVLPGGQRVGSAELVILDSDLTPSARTSMPDDARIALRNQKGETLARQLQTHTTVGTLVVANRKVSRSNFDLSLWTWSDGVADVYVAGADLKNPSLWTGQGGADEFNPWYWPAISELVDRTAAKEFDGAGPETKLFAWLDVQPESLEQEQLDAFAELESPQEVRLLDLAKSQFGQLNPESESSAQSIQSMCQSVLRRWVQRILVPPQNVLVDLPHLVQRFPALLNDPADADEWQSTTLKSPRAIIPRQLDGALHTRATELYGRPVFHIDRVRERVASATRTVDGLQYGFAEDVSRFYPTSDLNEFTSNVPGPYFRRYVRSLDRHQQDILYAPALRRSMSS